MTHCDATGYLASGLVLAAFGMKDMVKLRIVAIASNIVFLAYGLSLDLTPVWLLHATLLPLNVWRLAQAWEPSASIKDWIVWCASILTTSPSRERG